MQTTKNKEKQQQQKPRETATPDREREREKEDTPSPPPIKVLFDNRIKRKNVLALNEKVAAIREYEKLPVYKRIGRMFHCSPDQIKRIVHQKSAILQEWEQRTRRSEDAKILLKVVRVSMLGKAVYEWIRRMMYYKDFMITDGLIQKMALQFKSAMGLHNFFPHQDWCDKFRNTYQIKEHDSKLLSIAHTQGHSVQIKDIVRDVLSECLPEVPEISGDEDDEVVEVATSSAASTSVQSKEVNGKKESESNNNNDSKETKEVAESKASTKAAVAKSVMNLRMPQLQPLRQLVALPFQGGGSGMTQKVLVATPISHMGNQAKGSSTPMTMTIIPLTTIAQSSANQTPGRQTQSNTTSDRPLVPPPLLEIKQEIKTERPDTPEPQISTTIKQECMSEDEQQDEQPEALPSPQEKIIPKEPTPPPPPTVAPQATTRTNSNKRGPSKTLNAVDDDNEALSKLRKRIRVGKSPDKQEFLGFSETASSSFKEDPQMPPLPPLTKAPNLVNRTANKRQQAAAEKTPSLPAIKTCAEARRYLKLLEDFALFRENFRLIGLVTRADEVLRELDGNDDVDID